MLSGVWDWTEPLKTLQAANQGSFATFAELRIYPLPYM